MSGKDKLGIGCLSVIGVIGLFVVWQLIPQLREGVLFLGKYSIVWLVMLVMLVGGGVLIVLSRHSISIYHAFVQARRNHILLHTDTHYIVHLQHGEVVVTPVMQHKYNYSIREQAPQIPNVVVEAEPTALPAPIQTFRQLLANGTVQEARRQGKMILGYANGQLRYGSWLDLYSCGIGGVSGSGKTTTVRFLLFQAVLAHGKFVMVDPHIEEPEESLAAQFRVFPDVHVLPPCSDEPNAITKRVRWLMKEYLRREGRGIKGPPLIFVLDEFNAIIRRLPDELRKELADLLLTIAQGGRKFGIFAMLIGQRWSEQDLGGKNYGAAIRSSLASTMAHRFTDEDQAKKLIGSRNGARCLALAQGHCLFRDTQGTLSEMITPLSVEADGEYIQQLLDTECTGETTRNHDETTDVQPLPLRLVRAESTPETTDLHTKAREIVRLQASGIQKAEIMRRIWNVNPGGSEEYRRAIQEYQQVMILIAERMGEAQ